MWIALALHSKLKLKNLHNDSFSLPTCLLPSALPGSIWKSEMLETCLEKPVFRASVEREYQQDQMVIENIFRQVSSVRQGQIGSIKVLVHSHRSVQISFILGWSAVTWEPSLSAAWLLGYGGQKPVPTSFSWLPCRWLNADLCSVLLLSLLWQQRIGDDRLAVPLLRGQHRRLERPGRDHCRALPHG